MWRSLICVFVVLFAVGCTEAVTGDPDQQILLMGDSMMAVNAGSGNAVADALERELGKEVVDRSVTAARYFYYLPVSGSAGLKIEKQYRPGNWSWIIMNGGGNDLVFGCGCFICDWQLNRLISEDGTEGAIPEFVNKMRQTGARVVYTGYLRSPGRWSIIDGCRDEGNKLDGRLAQMAARDPGVYFVSLADLVPNGDDSYFAIDLVHPSVKGSQAIAKRVADVIKPAMGR